MNMSNTYLEHLNGLFLLLDNVIALKQIHNNSEEYKKLSKVIDEIKEEILIRLGVRERQ